jgi:integrase
MMDLKGIGRHMPRARHQRGHVTVMGTRVKQWVGWYYVYQQQGDGTEKRVHKSEVLGTKAGMPKWKAQEKLSTIIDKANAGANVTPSPEYTLRWFWEQRYRPMKEPGWKVSSRPKTVWFVEHHVIAPFADVPLGDLDRFALQKHLNELATGFSRSLVTKFRVYIKAILGEALEQEFIGKNPARKLDVPQMREQCKRALNTDELRELLLVVDSRDHLALHMFGVLALRPGEMFALRRNDVNGGRLRIDESVAEALTGPNRIVAPKTEASVSHVWLPPSIRVELAHWMEHMADKRPEAFLFASETGGPMSPKNFLNRNLKRATAKALARMKREGREIPAGFLEGVNFQALRRTCATRLQKHGNVKDIQAHLRHASPDVTAGVYMQEIPESVRAAVEALDRELTGEPVRKVAVAGTETVN